jgi:hypothetical protein
MQPFVREGKEEREPDFDYSDGKKLAAQLQDFERIKNARFVARFDDTGQENVRTAVGVLPLGRDPRSLKQDETYLRLRTILHQKMSAVAKGAVWGGCQMPRCEHGLRGRRGEGGTSPRLV